jgi:hypothetical protein
MTLVAALMGLAQELTLGLEGQVLTELVGLLEVQHQLYPDSV